jgi:folate-binding protein YgfZ
MIETGITPQYRIIAAGAGWIENLARGRLRFEGADRLAFLQALLTNEIESLRPGTGTYALYLTPQGRMITDLHVFVRPDSVVADVPAAAAATLARTFDSLIFAEDVRVADISQDTCQISVMGGGAAATIAAALDLVVATVRDLPTWSQLDVAGGFLVRTDDSPDGSWDLIVERRALNDVTAAIARAGAVAASAEIVDVMRIEAGRPKFGVDMTTETIPLEAGLLDRAISQTKGCYVGQEVIIRVLHRGGGRVAKRLARLHSESLDASVPVAGAALSVDGKEIGHVTSAARSPRDGHAIALGYVHRDVAEAGRHVMAASPDGPAQGSTLPIDFVIAGLSD